MSMNQNQSGECETKQWAEKCWNGPQISNKYKPFLPLYTQAFDPIKMKWKSTVLKQCIFSASLDLREKQNSTSLVFLTFTALYQHIPAAADWSNAQTPQENGAHASESVKERCLQQLGLPQLGSAALTIRISKVTHNTTKHLSPGCCC